MPRPLFIVLCAALAAPAAPALGQSQLARQVLPELRRAGVSESCIAQLGQHDFATLKTVLDTDDRNHGWKRRNLKFLAERACGETRSFLFDMLR